MSDPWEDVFAQAAGTEPTLEMKMNTNRNRPNKNLQSSQRGTTISAGSSPLDDESQQQQQQQQLNHVRDVKGGSATASASYCWPSQFTLGSSLLGKGACKKFKPSAPASSPSSSGNIKNSKCRRCGSSGAQHLLRLSKNYQQHKSVEASQEIYVHTRNIRCCATYGINVAYAQRKAAEIMRLYDNKMQNKCNIFNSKCRALRDAIDCWCNVAIKQSGVTDPHTGASAVVVKEGLTSSDSLALLNERIAVIVAADALYCRLYYNQVAGNAGIIEASRHSHVPNLRDHFVTPNLARDVYEGEESWKSFLSNMNEHVEGKEAIPCTMADMVRFDDESPSNISNPLFELYKARMKETVHLFYASGWYKHASVQRQHIDALRAYRSSTQQQEEHETPAAKALVMWRDSCRDFACNVYAYASITAPMLKKMKEVLVSNGIESMIEIGAGTGYIANLIEQAGLPIQALDIAPTSNCINSFNDYHGKSPSFTLVEEGGPSSLLSLVHIKKKALLLCYPPPGSSMARDCLTNYMRSGGNYIVHIGEFAGLTGCARFETILLTYFRCELRMSCPSWGTDAAFLTIFKRNDGKCKEENTILIPCSNCSVRPATKRCLLVRSLAYCGKNCFLQHSRSRREIFRERMIYFDTENSKYLDFEYGMCYCTIKECRADGTETAVPTNRAKNRKKRRTRR